MINSRAPSEFGPGLTRRAYLDQLTKIGYTGWHDEHGIPAPWPEDFCEPEAGWQPTTGGGHRRWHYQHQPQPSLLAPHTEVSAVTSLPGA